MKAKLLKYNADKDLYDNLSEVTWKSPTYLRKVVLAKKPLERQWLIRSDLYGCLIFLRIIGPFIATLLLAPYLWLIAGPLSVVPIMLMLGVYGYKISFIMHDCSHDSLFRARYYNDYVGVVCGWLVGADYYQFKLVHRDHHLYNLTKRDPQFEEAAGLQRASKFFLLWHLTKALIGGRIGGYFNDYHLSAKEKAVPGRVKSFLRTLPTILSQIIIMILITDFGEVPILALAYPISASTISLFLARLRTFAEHVEPADLSLPDFVRTHRANWFDQFFLYDANFNYHFEHHLFPAIASCHLHSIHQSYKDFTHSDLSLGGSMFSTIVNRLKDSVR